MKVYLIVYGCEPHQGGEHEVGWKVANELVNECDLKVITRKSNQKLIEQNNDKNIDFTFIENDTFIGFKPRGKFSYLYYLFWQFSVYMHLKRMVKKEDIIHYLTFGNLHLPHFLFLLKSKLILGPMGGGSFTNTFLLRRPSLKEKVKSSIHYLVNISLKINLIYFFLFKKSSKIILRTEETLKLVPPYFHNKCTVFLETGVNSKMINYNPKVRKLEKIILTSRFVEHKNIIQTIEVFLELEKLQSNKITLTLCGDGPTRIALENQYSNHENIDFKGKIPHETIAELLVESDLFLFCSIKEGGSHSIFEAAMNNIPIACYDISGMTEFPKNDSSIKIVPTRNIDNNVRFLAEKIIKYFNEEKIDNICANAIKDLKENYDWEKVSHRYIEIYKELENRW